MILDHPIFNRRNIFYVAIIVFVITAIKSKGYYHADEHFQIIEFSEYKMGHRTAESLPWEFKTKMRSAIQPGLTFTVQKSLDYFNVTSPYTLTLILRLLTSVMALFVIRFFIQQTEKLISDERTKIVYHLLSYFLWFIPFVSVRFSSETWSGLLFLLGISLFLQNRKQALLIGAVLGFSFLFRFQIAFAIAGLGIWVIFTQKERFSFYFNLGLSFVLVLFIGTVIDYWFYGEWIFTPWHYFDQNILQGAASNFGEAPWYFYLIRLIFAPSIFVGIPLAIAMLILLIKQPKNLFLWIFLSFLIGHSIVAHKETRFLFPVIYLFPILLIMGYLEFKKRLPRWQPAKVFFVAFVLVNVLGIVIMSQKSAGLGYMELTSFIHENYGDKPTQLIHTPYANPYCPWSNEKTMYSEKQMKVFPINRLCDLDEKWIAKNRTNLVVAQSYDLDRLCRIPLIKHDFVAVNQSIPNWIVFLNEFYRGFDEGNVLVLFEQKDKVHE